MADVPQEMTRTEVIKAFFGQGEGARPIENKELLALMRDDPAGAQEIAELCAEKLGVTLKLPAESQGKKSAE